MTKGKTDLRNRRKNEPPDTCALKHKSRGGPRRSKRKEVSLDANRQWILLGSGVLLLLTVAGFIAYKAYLWHLYNLVRTPLNAPPVMPSNSSRPESNPELFWGTYRPQLYFGVRHRSPHSLLAGLLWFQQGGMPPRIRYECSHDDHLKRYNWLQHDGRQFGKQHIVEEGYSLNTTFVKRVAAGRYGGDWTARISVGSNSKTQPGSTVSVLFYIYLPDSSRGRIQPFIEGHELNSLEGETAELGAFRITFHRNAMTSSGAAVRPQLSHLVSHVPREDQIQQTILTGMGLVHGGLGGAGGQRLSLVGRSNAPPPNGQENIWVFEMTATAGEFNLEVAFESGSGDSGRPPLVGPQFDQELADHVAAFEAKFSRVFPLDKKKYNEKQIAYAKSALSNLLGGMGYFYGTSMVMSEHTAPDAVLYWAAPLFTATPSRPQFPRGFLWDEGFHGLLLARWDPDLALESVGHWLDLINVEGWIPREQILGWEARARVPAEFVVQNNHNGNPPALVMVIEDILDNWSSLDEIRQARSRDLLLRALPRLTAWYNWFNTTQIGSLPGSYRWRGRDPNNPRQLNPLTLTSGLDDYPRASHPSVDERHLDLRCWMALFSRVMAKLWERLGPPQEGFREGERYVAWSRLLSNETLLNQLHWSEQRGHYADYGQHTDKVSLVRPQPSPGQNPHQPQQQLEKIRQVRETPRPQLVPVVGYVSLFPLLLRLLPPDSARLAKLLADLNNDNLLWTKFGLRSLARNAVLYQRHNTEHDPPYWRGSIWVNMNYLSVRALRYYAQLASPSQATARLLADQLRDNIVNNILNEVERTGFLWEQYDDTTGHGLRAHPFSGWTALVVLMMTDS